MEQLTPDYSFFLPSFTPCPFHSNPHCKSFLSDSRQPQSGLWVPDKVTDFPLVAPPENSHFMPSSDLVLSILTSTEELVVLPCSRFRGMQ